MKRITSEPAFVLHRRAYRESSFLIELFGKNHGRFSVISKGIRKANSAYPGLLQPFVPLLISFSGKNELMTLTDASANGEMIALKGECLFAGFYLNELLMYLLQKWDPHPALFDAYEKTVQVLQMQPLEQKTLRAFEKFLLEELGYGLLSKSDTSLHKKFSPEQHYRFIPEIGFVLTEMNEVSKTSPHIFSGKNLLAIAKENWEEGTHLQDAKRLTRLILAPLLGSRKIFSRQLFLQPELENSYE